MRNFDNRVDFRFVVFDSFTHFVEWGIRKNHKIEAVSVCMLVCVDDNSLINSRKQIRPILKYKKT